jgi:hypothetical protein
VAPVLAFALDFAVAAHALDELRSVRHTASLTDNAYDDDEDHFVGLDLRHRHAQIEATGTLCAGCAGRGCQRDVGNSEIEMSTWDISCFLPKVAICFFRQAGRRTVRPSALVGMGASSQWPTD